jgi:ligand-binding SRPBCC domain-containing protein
VAIHVFRRSQIVAASLEQCWSFFSDARNLSRITPPALDFRVLSELPATIHPGLMIRYRVRPLLGIPLIWLTEITHVRDGYFVDEQRIGPYALWHHEHFFSALNADTTEIRDLIHYAPPFGPFGELVHPWLVLPQLEKIFAFRERAVAALWPAN